MSILNVMRAEEASVIVKVEMREQLGWRAINLVSAFRTENGR